MINPYMVYDRFTHGRWSMMDFHIGDDLLNGWLTLVGCLHDILP
jgi:hypothetical protein